MSRLKGQAGFTLTELVISLAVIGIMAAAFTATKSMIVSAQVGPRYRVLIPWLTARIST